MTAAYDTYNYPAYWDGREYEHESEVLALKSLLARISEIKKLIDIGAGFGRLTPYYAFRAKKVVLTDPSGKLLKEAKERLKEYQHIKFVSTGLEEIKNKFSKGSFDLAIMTRVLHHLNKPEVALPTIARILTKGGHLILEFPNKVHWKAVIINFFKGDFTFPIDILPADKAKRRKTIPFYNFHPEEIERELKENGFEILEKRSVSNIRSPFLKKFLPLELLLSVEKLLQTLLASLNFGPSIFVLAKKVN